VSTVGNIKDGMKVALDLAQAANRAEDYAKLIETQQTVMAVLEENRELRDRNRALEDELELESKLVRIKDCYFVREDDESQTGPICPNCYMKDRIVAVLFQPSSTCPRCRERYGAPPRLGPAGIGGR
jgi:hypothetical protein